MRAPFQIIVFPYRHHNNDIEVLIGKRADGAYWQAISGGGEDTETHLEAAIRELKEETSLSGENWVKLDSMCTLPKIYYRDHLSWAAIDYVIPEYAYMVKSSGTVHRSSEHSELAWMTVDRAMELLKYDSNKNALWELRQRHHSQYKNL